MDRKIIQLTVAGSDNYPDVLYALCDDGTVWQKSMLENIDWIRVDIKTVTGSPK
jgi:hypothetical protein